MVLKVYKIVILIFVAFFFSLYSPHASAQLFPGLNGWKHLGLTDIPTGSVALAPTLLFERTLFANTAEGIYKSTNAGGTWTQLTNGLPPANPSSFDPYRPSIAVSPNYATDQTVFVSFPHMSTVYRSTDGGASWQVVNSQLAQDYPTVTGLEIGISPNFAADHTVFIASSIASTTSLLAKSTDGGNTWQVIHPLPDDASWQGITDFGFSPNYSTGQTVFATLHMQAPPSSVGVIKSIDGGATWTLSIPFIENTISAWSVVLSPNYATNQTVFVGSDALDGVNHLIKSLDGGTTWQPASSGIPPTDVQDIVFGIGQRLYAGTGGDGLYLSNNSGNSWTRLNGNPPYSDLCGGYYSIAVPRLALNRTVYGACGGNGIWKYGLVFP